MQKKINTRNGLKKTSWLKSRPKKVQEAILKYPPFFKYKLKTTGQIVNIYSYSENSIDRSCKKCTILILPKDNPDKLMMFARKVFDIKLKNLIRIKNSNGNQTQSKKNQ